MDFQTWNIKKMHRWEQFGNQSKLVVGPNNRLVSEAHPKDAMFKPVITISLICLLLVNALSNIVTPNMITRESG